MLNKEDRRNRQTMIEETLACAENLQGTSSRFNTVAVSRPSPEYRVDLPRIVMNSERDDLDATNLPSPKLPIVQFEANLQTPGHLS